MSDSKPGITAAKNIETASGIALADGKALLKDKDTLCPHQVAGHPAGLDRRVWISSGGEWPSSGDRPGCARGRKQSRYHPRWREVRDETKYERMTHFADALPRIRERVNHDLGLAGFAAGDKVLATIVSLMEADAHPRGQRGICP